MVLVVVVMVMVVSCCNGIYIHIYNMFLALVALVQVTAWIREGLQRTLPGQPGQFGHGGNEQYTVRTMGSRAASGSKQFCITTFDWASLCMVFSVIYRWYSRVPFSVDRRGWRMMSVRLMA